MKRLDVSENTSISMPARNLISIIGACLVGAWFGFGVIERLNTIESDIRLMSKDLEAANTFIDLRSVENIQPSLTGLASFIFLNSFSDAQAESLKASTHSTRTLV